MVDESGSDKLEIAFQTHPRTILGEGPSWDPVNQLLYWVDLKGKKLHLYRPERKTNETFEFNEFISCVVPCGFFVHKVLVALQSGLYYFNIKTRELEWISSPEKDKPSNRFNDGKCDIRGRFLCGTMDNEEGEQALGSLYLLKTDLTVEKILENIRISNGISFSKDSKTMFFIDSPLKKVDAFDYDIESGKLSNRRTVIQIEDGLPDGMTIDSDGMLWIAHWNGGCITRWDPHTGNLLRKIELPTKLVTSCAFGGRDLDVLYITTASIGVDLEKDAFAGTLFVLKNPGVHGILETPFLSS